MNNLAGGTIHLVAADQFFSWVACLQVPLLLKKDYVYREQRNLLMHEIRQKLHSFIIYILGSVTLSVGPEAVT